MTLYVNRLKSSVAEPLRTYVSGIASVIGALFLLVALSSAAQGQVTGGTISGTVNDPSSSAIPGATVLIQNRAKGENRTVTTNENGFYSAPNLTPGNYDVMVSLTGFKTALQNKLILEVGQELVTNIQLNVGDFSEKVTITDSPFTVNTTSATLHKVAG